MPIPGAIAAGLGFFLPWDISEGMSGFDFFTFSFRQVSQLDTGADLFLQQLFMTALMLLLVLILIAALLGILNLTASRGVRASTAVISVLALVDLLGFYAFVITRAQLFIQDVVESTGFGLYLTVFGLLWMIITSLFVPKKQPVMYNPYY